MIMYILYMDCVFGQLAVLTLQNMDYEQYYDITMNISIICMKCPMHISIVYFLYFSRTEVNFNLATT